jgi:hypothetical protein
MASKTKKPASKSKSAAKPKAAASKAAPKKVAPKKAAPKKVEKPKVAPKKEAPKKETAPKATPAKEAATEGLKLDPALRKGARALTKAAPIVALSKILPKEELAASYVLADSEVDDFEEDEKARAELDDEIEEDVEGPPEWWKDDPAAIEGADDEDAEKADFDDSDEWTEDDEWADEDKKSDADSDEDDREW